MIDATEESSAKVTKIRRISGFLSVKIKAAINAFLISLSLLLSKSVLRFFFSLTKSESKF